jgi:anaerobic magnesium-protoporphyrin IX monomethyl ester cyclase
MRLIIINPNSKKLYQSLAPISAIEPNIWAGLLANSVRGICDVQIYDMEAEPPDDEAEFISRLDEYDADCFLFVVTGQNPNASSASMSGATESAKLISEHFHTPIGFVGPHVNALPYETLERHDFIDFVFTNEGVYALRNLIANKFKCEDIKGVWYRDRKTNEIRANQPEGIVPQEKLGVDLPGMAFDLLPSLDKYRTSQWHANYQPDTSPFTSVYTSLGCFAKCSFCMINIINRTNNDTNAVSSDFNTFRYWDPEFTIKQLEYLADQGVKHIKIADEMFVYRPKHFMRLCELIIERGLKFNIWAYSRIDTAKPKYLETLKRAGVNWLALGIESANQVVRQEIDKGRFKDVNIRDIVKSIQDHGIAVVGNYIVGLTGDTHETMLQTKDLAFELLTENMNVYCATSLPGSPLYMQDKLAGRRLPTEYSEFGFLSYDHVPSRTDSLTSEEILKFRDQFFEDYFTHQPFLDKVYSLYGGTAVQTIRDMTKLKIRRKLLE